MKTCGECRACCIAAQVVEINKPSNVLCPNYDESSCKCKIYQTRPLECSNFNCLWLSQEQIPDNLRPDRCGMLFEMPSGGLVYIGTEMEAGAHMRDENVTLVYKIVQSGHPVVLHTKNEGIKYKLPEGYTPQQLSQQFDNIAKVYNRNNAQWLAITP